ncbi:hypothetical protein DFH28DRAFT_187594 [Melampsora americana]|nr:hypothetical protein DFH28DRAFT_187594 [Melampsora americana]
MPIGRPATPFPDMDFDQEDDGEQSEPSHPRPPRNVRNYLDNSGVLITERIRRPSLGPMIPVPANTNSRKTSKEIKPSSHHHHKPEALVAELSSSNGKNLKRLSLILKGDPNEILKPSKKSIHPSTSTNSNRSSVDHSSTSTSTPGLSSSSSSTPKSGSSSTSNGLGKLQQDQLLHLSKLKEKERDKDKDSHRKSTHELKGKECIGSFQNERYCTLDRIKCFGIGYG